MHQARKFCKTLLRPSLASLQRQSVLSQRCLIPASWRSSSVMQPHARYFSDAATVPAKLVKELRDRTGASMGKCRDALKEEGGDLEKAVEWLKKRGVRSMEKRTAESAEALMALGMEGDSGAILEIKAETDFVTRSELFQQVLLFLARSVAKSPPGPVESIQSLILEDGPGRPQQLTTGIALPEALLELGSVLGEKLVLGEVQRLTAASGAGVVGGYVHPKSADGMPGTGRMAALISLRPLPSEGCDMERLRVIAAHLARHAVAAQPRFVSVDSIPAETLRKEREVFRAAYLEQLGSRKAGAVDEKVVQKVLDGKTNKFYQETVLACQELVAPQVSTGGKSEAKPIPVSEWLQDEARSLGLEKIVLEDFRLYVI